MAHWIALDIGGANLKAADGSGFAVSRPFALWQRRQELAAALAELMAECPAADRLAVTMTGELADCFVTKAEGVAAILEAVEAAAGRRLVRVYLTDGSWSSPAEAIAQPLLAAASNWHALARFAGRFVSGGTGLLIDIGSTTCDIIPLHDGQVVAQGRSDPERLMSNGLVYTGVERSPVCAVTDRVWWPSQKSVCPLAQEMFATTRDAYLLLGDLPEEPASTHTADGRPATKTHAHERIARSICADSTMVSREDAVQMAQCIADAQHKRIAEALQAVFARQAQRPAGVVVSGIGEFLARRVLRQLKIESPVVSLSRELGSDVSRAATAHALAVLAAETDGGIR
jgi:probable H4MPT-linked C1 transfer pathway protein